MRTTFFKPLSVLIIIAMLASMSVAAAQAKPASNGVPNPILTLAQDGFSADFEGNGAWAIDTWALPCDGSGPIYSVFEDWVTDFHVDFPKEVYYTDSIVGTWVWSDEEEDWVWETWLLAAETRECTPAFNPWTDAYKLHKFVNSDPARPPLLKPVFWIHTTPEEQAPNKDAVLKWCNSAKFLPAPDPTIKDYNCDLKFIKEIADIQVQINMVTGQVRSDDPEWPTSAYNPHWFNK